MLHKATRLICENLEEKGIKFVAEEKAQNRTSSVLVPFAVKNGPVVYAKFISRDEDNDVSFRIYGLLTGIPEEKRVRLMETCNRLNFRIRYLKFTIDNDGDINAEFDFPMNVPDDALGDVADEMVARSKSILDEVYSTLIRARFTDGEPEEEDDEAESFLRRMMREAAEAADGEDEDDEDGDGSAEDEETEEASAAPDDDGEDGEDLPAIPGEALRRLSRQLRAEQDGDAADAGL